MISLALAIFHLPIFHPLIKPSPKNSSAQTTRKHIAKHQSIKKPSHHLARRLKFIELGECPHEWYNPSYQAYAQWHRILGE